MTALGFHSLRGVSWLQRNKGVRPAVPYIYIPSIVMLGKPNITPFAKHMINPVKLGIPNLTIEIKDLFWRLEMLEDI
jgi:hypothetical protein